MQIDDRIHPISVCLMMLGIMTSALVALLLSNNAFAQPLELLHNQTLYEQIKEISGVHESAQIDVGDSP